MSLQVIDLTKTPSKTESVIRLMAETLGLLGYSSIKASCTGYKSPEMVMGAVQDAAPALYADKPKPLYLDVSFFEDVAIEEVKLRWQLFSSASDLSKGKFHVAVPALVNGRFTDGKTLNGRDFAKKLADSCGVDIDRVWEI